MPTIKFSADLRNDYNGISYEQLTARFELYTSVRQETAPLFELCVEAITVQTFRDMAHYNDIPKRICFCCDGGMNRSVLAANILNDLAVKHGIPMICEARSAYSNTHGLEIPHQVWGTLEENGIHPDKACLTARYLEGYEISHFSDFIGIIIGAMSHFSLLGIPEERFAKISEYFAGVDDPQYGSISYQEAFQDIYRRADRMILKEELSGLFETIDSYHSTTRYA